MTVDHARVPGTGNLFFWTKLGKKKFVVFLFVTFVSMGGGCCYKVGGRFDNISFICY